jgi:hypothetical protein
MEVVLDDMPYAKGARHSIEKSCLPGTRCSIIRETVDWANGTLPDRSSNDRRILLLSGLAGTGKSAVAHTVAKYFDELGRLGSSYFFDSSKPALSTPDNFFGTISRDLADLDHQWKQALWKVVEGKRALRSVSCLQEQFEQFLLRPAEGLTNIGPTVIVVDALDESGDLSTRKSLISLLAARISELPFHIRIIITARPEADIQKAFLHNPLVYWRNMEDIDEVSTLHDIATYIDHELKDATELEVEWPNKVWLKMLVENSRCNFRQASVIVSRPQTVLSKKLITHQLPVEWNAKSITSASGRLAHHGLGLFAPVTLELSPVTTIAAATDVLSLLQAEMASVCHFRRLKTCRRTDRSIRIAEFSHHSSTTVARHSLY